MHTSPSPEPRARLLPEGRRWGFGAQSLLPYLAQALDARPGDEIPPAESIRNPVFHQMEQVLRGLDRRI